MLRCISQLFQCLALKTLPTFSFLRAAALQLAYLCATSCFQEQKRFLCDHPHPSIRSHIRRKWHRLNDIIEFIVILELM